MEYLGGKTNTFFPQKGLHVGQKVGIKLIFKKEIKMTSHWTGVEMLREREWASSSLLKQQSSIIVAAL